MINAIHKILFKSPSPKNTRDRIKIIEQDKQSNTLVTEVMIRKDNRSITLVYFFDDKNKNIDLFPLFDKTNRGLCLVADACIFYEYKNKLYVLICEMKSENTTGAAKQIKSTKRIVDYILANATKYSANILPVEYKGIIFKYGQSTVYQQNTSSFKINYQRDENIDFVHIGYLEKLHINCFCN